mmetsp:Transcript_7900/g.14021  ORF Transcript_7900/g.14021 Transcript_7900/m.14021 type:complete len:93 (+) Transcript_7900:1-279(+)
MPPPQMMQQQMQQQQQMQMQQQMQQQMYGQMPSDWVCYPSPQGQYFYNERTGETAWQLPPGVQARSAVQANQGGYGQNQWGQQGYGGGQSWY